MERAVKAVIFDMDGVLVDTEMYYIEAFDLFFREAGFQVPGAVLNKSVGCSELDFHNLLTAGGYISWTFSQYMDKFEAYKREHPLSYGKRLNPGVEQTLRELRNRGFKVGLASSTAMAGIKRMLFECGLEGYFDNVLSGEMFARSKPDPEIYLKSAADLSLSPGQCFAVEDSDYGIAAAKAAGMTVAAKADGRFGFDQSRADYHITEIADILALLVK